MILSNCQDVNDMLLNQLNSIASLLNLNYYQKGGYLFIIDSENGKSSVLEKKGDNKYSFSIEKDGENIKVEFDYNSLSIEKSNKFIYMNDNSLYFANNNDDEKSYLDLFYKGDLIFNKENNDIKSHLTIKSENEKYYQIIKENRIKDTTGITNEKIVIAEAPYTVANHLIHRYDLNQKLKLSGLEQRKSSRKRCYILHAMTQYVVDENFPAIRDTSFVGGAFPTGIESLTYTLSLDGIEGERIF